MLKIILISILLPNILFAADLSWDASIPQSGGEPIIGYIGLHTKNTVLSIGDEGFLMLYKLDVADSVFVKTLIPGWFIIDCHLINQVSLTRDGFFKHGFE